MKAPTLLRSKAAAIFGRQAEQPLRSELFSSEQLVAHSILLATNHQVRPGGSCRLLERLDLNEDLLRQYHRETRALDSSVLITPAGVWMLDNFYLIEDQIQLARRHLPRGYSRELPQLVEGPSTGFPRVYGIVLELISHLDAQIDAASLNAFFAAYQQVAPLKLGELWAVPIMLRLALIENLQRVASRLNAARADRISADYWIGRMQLISEADPSRVVVVVAEMADANVSMSSSFVAQFSQRMARKNPALRLAQDWLEHKLAAQGESIEQLVRQESQMQAANQITVSNCIASLRFLGAADWRDFVEGLSVVEKALRTDPAGIYPRMDFATRDRYRHAVEGLARFGCLTEADVALGAVRLAEEGRARDGASDRRAHVGHYLIGNGAAALELAARPRWPWRRVLENAIRRAPLAYYLAGIGMLTGLVTLSFAIDMSRYGLGGWKLALLCAAFLLVASQMAVAVVNWASMMLVGPRLLPRMDYSKGIPADCATIVVIPSMLTSAVAVDHLVETLELHYLANRDEHLHFALLTDFPDAAEEAAPADDALIARARSGIEMLQQRYPGASKFYLFHRPRLWNVGEGAWIGYERKRGKLGAFNRILRGHGAEAFSTIVGDVAELRGIRYVITLDTDTQLPRDAAARLVATMAHPLNQAIIDPIRRVVTQGYGILQPRVGVSLPSSRRSWFVRLFAGDAGIDPYTRAVSDIYQDIFGEGAFIGKGIYDIDAFEGTLGGRFPENTILSHDLIESCFARSALVSDVELLEPHPSRYTADIDRRHRWIRGDWQIVRWIQPRIPTADGGRIPTPLSPLSRWKLFDNLRRSLVPLALLVILPGGWLLCPVGGPFVTIVAMTLLLAPAVFATIAELGRRSPEMSLLYFLGLTVGSFIRRVAQVLLALSFLPYEAAVNADAIGRSLLRGFVTHRRRLEWRPSGDSDRLRHGGAGDFFWAMWFAPTTAAAAAIVLAIIGPSELSLAAPILALWLAAPWIAWRLSQPIAPPSSQLSADQVEFLHRTALRTWGFFETFVTARENWLPPDNFQEESTGAVASRTSPTNIGLSLLANLAARDFGYLSAGRLVRRTQDTLATLRVLEKHRGHFFNWYDTRSLEPLLPRYVSTVDSGNLAGMLLTLAAGLRGLADELIFTPQAFAGLRDTVSTMREVAADQSDFGPLDAALSEPPGSLHDSREQLEKVRKLAEEFVAGLTIDADAELRKWAAYLVLQCEDHRDELLHLSPSLEGEVAPTLRELSVIEPPGAGAATARMALLESLAQTCEEMARMEWPFLFDSSRKLFVIGYNLTEHRLDTGYYDLLASEARLGSYVAIAQGAVSQEHWFSLGRLLVATRGEPIMISWSGSMFEYLMPQLLMPNYENTLIARTCISAVQRQIEYSKLRGVPWGISESGYNRTDAQMNYQYRAFGVPGTGLKRGLADDLVVAPYASVMALMVAPREACENMERLAKEGRAGMYGFYEAIDYTPSRMPPNQASVTIRSFMAHHQGMSLLALVSLLCGKPMQRRFEACPMLKAATLLLQERVPRTEAGLLSPELEVKAPLNVIGHTGESMRTFTTPHSASPEVHLLSNGRYHVAISSAGGGFSRWNNLDVTRWREDATRDCWGFFIYVRDVDNGKYWSVAHQPTLHATKQYEAIFAQGRAEFRQRHMGLAIHTEVGVSPEDDIEIRRVSITNLSRQVRTIELTSYAEVVMATAASDAAHPAFSNLFVQTAFEPELSAIFCTRRPRSHDEHPPCMLHLVVGNDAAPAETSCETDRSRFVGRAGSLTQPDTIRSPGALSNTAGAVLDPIVSLRRTVRLEPGEKATVLFMLGMAPARESASELAKKYQNPRMADRAFDLAWTHNQIMLRQLNATESEAQLYGRLAGYLIYANPACRADAATLRRNRRGQSSLWAYGISGDAPIVLLRIGDIANIEIVEQLVKAHAYWRMKGLPVELVIVNEDVSAYRQSLHDAIMGMIALGIGAPLIDKPGGIFVRRHEQIADENLMLLQSVARVVLDAENGSLERQVKDCAAPTSAIAKLHHFRPRGQSYAETPLKPRTLLFDNGLGGFSPDGCEYVITLQPGQATPAPWINVITNRFFGTAISESGSAYTWLENAREYRLTPWSNDPVQDTSGEVFYIRDDETGEYWSPTPMPARGATPYVIRHGFGYTVFEHSENGISSELWIFVAADAPVKFAMLKLRNLSGRPRRISATAYYEWVLADARDKGLMHAHTDVDAKTGALLARNSYHADLPNRIAFVDGGSTGASVTGDRREFIGRNGNLARPAAMRNRQLSGKVGAGLDPCGAIMVAIELRAGEEHEFAFRLGVGRSPADVQVLIARFRATGACKAALDEVRDYWKRTLGAVQVATPDAAVNAMANGWLLYQTLSCRMWGRTGFYQSGGAYGFRDQLQDAMALVHCEPDLVREHLLRAAAHQFLQGDVQHWWHPPVGRGVRTHFSDDYLWLPFTVCHYMTTVGDSAILDEVVPFLDSRLLRPEEESLYDLPARSDETASLYIHCVRAIENGLKFGAHGLPLIGCGDWNDGMNKVGAEGRGESVWLAFFLYTVLRQFAVVAAGRKDVAFAERCLAQAEQLHVNIEEQAWDGAWYRRAYYDDGTPLGSSANAECRIDSLPQSWSVISGAGSPDRARSAMAAVDEQLISRDAKLVRLFDPPFDRTPHDPGYIKGYIPGVRENGGQYTHGAIWAAMAFALMGEHEKAWELFTLLNPVNHGSTPQQIATYKVEPYVIAADVYSLAPHTGRGGWTWYTGSAGWMYRLLLETLLGVNREGAHLRISPRLPAAWESIVISYRYMRATYRIEATRSTEATVPILDGVQLPDHRIPLLDEAREHRVQVAFSPLNPSG